MSSNNNNALIGYTGFVGTTLMAQTKFDYLYRSTNIEDIKYKNFDTIVCAAAPAQKWIANKEPEKDISNINKLIECLKHVKCNKFILISTVDVYKTPVNVDENMAIDEEGLHPYGLNRRHLEKFVEGNFSNHFIARLPGLVGDGLKKNIIYDLKNNNNVDQINHDNIFQFYPMKNLWKDIHEFCRHTDIMNFATEPVQVSDIAERCFGKTLNNPAKNKVSYDMRTIYGYKGYIYNQEDVMATISAYAKS